MKKTALSLFVICLFFVCISVSKNQNTMKVGVILPMEHRALSCITAGLKESLQEYDFHFFNAQGDPLVQKAIIEKLLREKYDLLIPVGTSTSEMTLRLAKKENVLCLAADRDIAENSKKNTTVLADEISIDHTIETIGNLLPHIQKITLFYSSTEKVAKEIPLLEKALYDRNIVLQKIMVSSSSDLYTTRKMIAEDTDAIFVLKDHLVVSGIEILAKEASLKQIPLITSDEGSLYSGGALCVGIKEKDIGSQGALIAQQILKGALASSIPSCLIKGPFSLFINPVACQKQGIDPEVVIRKAKNLSLPVVISQEAF